MALITDALACAASKDDTAFDPRVVLEDGVCPKCGYKKH